MTTQTINIAPSWEQTADLLFTLAKDGTPEGQRKARQELIRMGRLLDALINANTADSDATTHEADRDWVECDAVSDEERRRYLSDGVPEGYETVMGYFARFNPWAIKAGLADPEATQRDGFWLKHRANERGIEVVKVPAPAAFALVGIDNLNAYPISLLHERLGD